MFFFCSVPDSVATWCVSDQLSEKEDNLAEDCEESVEELVAVAGDTSAAWILLCCCQEQRSGARSRRPDWSGEGTKEVSRMERENFVEQVTG